MVTKTTKYTREVLETILPKAKSFYELARLVGIAPTGSNTTNLKRRCIESGLDLSHMTGQGHMKGRQARNKQHYSYYLVEGKSIDRRKEVAILRRAMIESGIEHKCHGENCILVNEWLGKPIRLQIDHIDGRYWNNKRDNLKFLCPNCHTQTDTWGK